MSGSYLPRQGLTQDAPDHRDFLYSDVFGAGDEVAIDWATGYNLFDEVGLTPIVYDQGQSSSCVAHATAAHTRVWYKRLANQDIDFSRHFIHSQISAGLGAGASLRDGVQLVANIGDCPESAVSSYDHGLPPDDAFMCSRDWMSEAVFNQARQFDRFSYRVVPGQTTDITLFAHAIQNNCGIVGGFTGTLPGWTQPLIRPPQVGEARFSHAVFLSGYGRYQGRNCLFTKNSWGGRYTIQDGPWRGYQAIPEDYFTAVEQTAVGPIVGAYVSNAWVLVPDAPVTPSAPSTPSLHTQLMTFLERNEGKIVQDSQQSGSLALVIGGKLLVARPERLTAMLATYLVRKEGVGMPRDLWNAAPKQDF